MAQAWTKKLWNASLNHFLKQRVLPKVRALDWLLLTSGYRIDGEAKEILERGCDGFIQRLFNIEELSKKIRELLDKGDE